MFDFFSEFSQLFDTKHVKTRSAVEIQEWKNMNDWQSVSLYVFVEWASGLRAREGSKAWGGKQWEKTSRTSSKEIFSSDDEIRWRIAKRMSERMREREFWEGTLIPSLHQSRKNISHFLFLGEIYFLFRSKPSYSSHRKLHHSSI